MVTRATLRVETNSGDAEAGVIPVDMTETHSQDPDTAEKLWYIIKIIEAVGGHIVIGKGGNDESLSDSSFPPPEGG